jgi:hypothetical protein
MGNMISLSYSLPDMLDPARLFERTLIEGTPKSISPRSSGAERSEVEGRLREIWRPSTSPLRGSAQDERILVE